MNKISQIDSYQVEQLLKRIEQIEAKLEIKVGSSGAESGKEAQNFCALPKIPPRTFEPSVSPDRARLIRSLEKKWVNGTKLRYYFFESGSNSGGNEQKEIARQGFEVWKNVGIGIKFRGRQTPPNLYRQMFSSDRPASKNSAY